jgi:hypothetical protein
MARWGTQFGHREKQTGSGRHGGNGGAADARVGVVGKHRAAEAEVRDTEVTPDGGWWRLAIGRRSIGAGAATRARD